MWAKKKEDKTVFFPPKGVIYWWDFLKSICHYSERTLVGFHGSATLHVTINNLHSSHLKIKAHGNIHRFKLVRLLRLPFSWPSTESIIRSLFQERARWIIVLMSKNNLLYDLSKDCLCFSILVVCKDTWTLPFAGLVESMLLMMPDSETQPPQSIWESVLHFEILYRNIQRKKRNSILIKHFWADALRAAKRLRDFSKLEKVERPRHSQIPSPFFLRS